MSFSCFQPATPTLRLPFSPQRLLCPAWSCPETPETPLPLHCCGIRASPSRPFGRHLQAREGQKRWLGSCRHPSLSAPGEELATENSLSPFNRCHVMLTRFCTIKSRERNKGWQKQRLEGDCLYFTHPGCLLGRKERACDPSPPTPPQRCQALRGTCFRNRAWLWL